MLLAGGGRWNRAWTVRTTTVEIPELKRATVVAVDNLDRTPVIVRIVRKDSMQVEVLPRAWCVLLAFTATMSEERPEERPNAWRVRLVPTDNIRKQKKIPTAQAAMLESTERPKLRSLQLRARIAWRENTFSPKFHQTTTTTSRCVLSAHQGEDLTRQDGQPSAKNAPKGGTWTVPHREFKNDVFLFFPFFLLPCLFLSGSFCH